MKNYFFKEAMKRLLSILLTLSLAAVADDFTFHIRMDNAQIEEVILGCAAKATDQYDKGLDIYAPPMGMGTAIAGFIWNRQLQMILYKDIRSTKLPQTWLLDCKLAENKPLRPSSRGSASQVMTKKPVMSSLPARNWRRVRLKPSCPFPSS